MANSPNNKAGPRGAAPPLPIVPGNINLNNRPVVHSADGSISTVKSATFTVGPHGNEKYLLIPTVLANRPRPGNPPSGRIVSGDEAFAHFRATGQHLGLFATETAADTYAQHLHEAQARRYLPKGQR
jgi:hypothetical protein